AIAARTLYWKRLRRADVRNRVVPDAAVGHRLHVDLHGLPAGSVHGGPLHREPVAASIQNQSPSLALVRLHRSRYRGLRIAGAVADAPDRQALFRSGWR